MYLHERINLYIWQKKKMLKFMFTLKKGTIRQIKYLLLFRGLLKMQTEV